MQKALQMIVPSEKMAPASSIGQQSRIVFVMQIKD
jgi:hypothetical protein